MVAKSIPGISDWGNLYLPPVGALGSSLSKEKGLRAPFLLVHGGSPDLRKSSQRHYES